MPFVTGEKKDKLKQKLTGEDNSLSYHSILPYLLCRSRDRTIIHPHTIYPLGHSSRVNCAHKAPHS